jgi:hypothetical protein
MKRVINKTIAIILCFLIVLSVANTKSFEASNVEAAGTKSIKGFIQTALKPLGTTMYIYGGGWKKTGSDWYYLKSSGAMAQSEYIGSYYVDENGKWVE